MKCKRCGRCCIIEGRILGIEKTDLKRWMTQNRSDILEHLRIWLINDEKIRGTELKTEQLEQINFTEGWFSPKGRRLNKCPFLKKEKNKPEFKCLIHDTKPNRCRDFKLGQFDPPFINTGYKCRKQKKRFFGIVSISKLSKDCLPRIERILSDYPKK